MGGSRSKGLAVARLRKQDDWSDKLAEILEEEPGFLIGLRVMTKIAKRGLFCPSQRGVVTDIERKRKRIFLLVTWDDTRDENPLMHRTVRFGSRKMWKYVDPMY